MTLRTLALIGLSLLAAMAARAETRLYNIDSRNAQEIAEALEDVVRVKCLPTRVPGTELIQAACHVELLPTGQIIVEAPPEAHAQIAEVLKAIAEHDAVPTPRVTLRYWVISGSRDGRGGAETPSGLAPVFAQLRRLHDDLSFTVEESASLTTESGTSARSETGTLDVSNVIRANGDSVRAEIRLEFAKLPGPACAQQSCNPFKQDLGLTVTIRRGEYLVLGELERCSTSCIGRKPNSLAARSVSARMTGVDEASWVELYRALEKPLYNVVYRWLWDPAESQDVVQEAFLRCWRRRDLVKADGFKGLVYQTALNLASNQRRRKRLWRLVSFESVPEAAADECADGIVSRPLREAVDALPESLKRVLFLSELAGMSYREIAEVTGVKEGTVGSRRNRALALLRRRLESAGGEAR
jgi:RNA polymerase sigma-70 factor, ECF subfamily